MKEEGRVLKDATIEQEEKFKRYAVMYEESKKEDMTKEALAEKYGIPLIYINPLLNGFIKAEKDIEKETKELAQKKAERKRNSEVVYDNGRRLGRTPLKKEKSDYMDSGFICHCIN